MADTIPVIWGQTSDGQDAYVHSCTKAVYNPETGKSLDEEMATCIPDSGENLPPTPIDAATLQGHAADYFATAPQLITSGDISDVQNTGLYYLGNAVTGKPTNTGGLYLLFVVNDTTSIALYAPNASNVMYKITKANNTSKLYKFTGDEEAT